MSRRISKITGLQRLTRGALRGLHQRAKQLTKIKTVQVRRLEATRKRRERKRQFEQMGPKMLCKKDAFEVSEEQAADLKRFWGDIWEVQGDYLRESRALRRWRSAAREAARSRLPEELPRDECWERTITKMANWKAPGPNGIHAAWLKRWNNVTTKV